MSGMNLIHQKEELFDRIERYYKGEGNLKPSEQKICERWELAFSLLQKHRSKKIAISKYLKILAFQGTEISKNTAYADFQKAEAIFTPIHKVSKDLQRIVLIESIEKDITNLKQRQQKKDCSERMFLAYQDQINKLYDLRIKAGGLLKDDPNLPDFSKIQMPDIQINVSPKIEMLLRQLTATGVVDTTELIKQLTEDAEIINQEGDDEESTQEG